jgi:outer membrane protein assembly factor BamB
LWHATTRNPQRIGSGVIVGGHLYVVNEQHTAQCFEAKSGRLVWEGRLPAGAIWSSIVQVNDRLYVINQEGTTIVFRSSPDQLEILAENPLGEASNSTLAVADGRMFVRTFEHLYCISEK